MKEIGTIIGIVASLIPLLCLGMGALRADEELIAAGLGICATLILLLIIYGIVIRLMDRNHQPQNQTANRESPPPPR